MSTIDMDMTSDPVEFTEAIEDFTARRVVTREEADALSEYARRRVWWISGVAQMDVVNDVQESIADAIRKGTPFEDWKKEIGSKIENAWGRKDSFRIETIWRNATTSAYNAGREEQMNEPHIVAVRPYQMLDVVDDARTSEICVKFIEPPVILPADDPRWFRLSPPFHHRCRTGKRSLRRSVAEKKGITTELPDLEIQDGWGISPRLTEPPKPSERDVPPDPELHVECMVKGGKDLRDRKAVTIPKRLLSEPKKRKTIEFDSLKAEKLPNELHIPGFGANPADSEEAFFSVTERSKRRIDPLLNDKERLSITKFSGGASTDVRDSLTMTEDEYLKSVRYIPYAEAKSHLANINSALDKAAIADLGVEKDLKQVYRGISELSKDTLNSIINHDEVVFEKPTSTSWDPAIAKSFYAASDKYHSVMFVITPSAKTRGLSIEAISAMQDEREILFGNGTRFKVTDVKRDSENANGAIVYLEELT